MTFYRFMLTHFSKSDDKFEDLATDIRYDPTFPKKAKHKRPLVKYLEQEGACEDCWEVFHEAYVRYYEETHPELRFTFYHFLVDVYLEDLNKEPFKRLIANEIMFNDKFPKWYVDKYDIIYEGLIRNPITVISDKTQAEALLREMCEEYQLWLKSRKLNINWLKKLNV